MAWDPKQTPTPKSPSANHRERGVVIFTYSKIIFMFPTTIIALICGIGMSLTHDQTSDPLARPAEAQASGAPAKAQAPERAIGPPVPRPPCRTGTGGSRPRRTCWASCS